ncbi:hypothetical protein LCGC14_1739830 [marine sediment metagenome]|uniref:Uncharacterized protein n=1 Tax=marine sediment metagenome TaxID=412755 RepID=A0A0F9JMA5_9ZZZZ
MMLLNEIQKPFDREGVISQEKIDGDRMKVQPGITLTVFQSVAIWLWIICWVAEPLE